MSEVMDFRDLNQGVDLSAAISALRNNEDVSDIPHAAALAGTYNQSYLGEEKYHETLVAQPLEIVVSLVCASGDFDTFKDALLKHTKTKSIDNITEEAFNQLKAALDSLSENKDEAIRLVTEIVESVQIQAANGNIQNYPNVEDIVTRIFDYPEYVNNVIKKAQDANVENFKPPFIGQVIARLYPELAATADLNAYLQRLLTLAGIGETAFTAQALPNLDGKNPANVFGGESNKLLGLDCLGRLFQVTNGYLDTYGEYVFDTNLHPNYREEYRLFGMRAAYVACGDVIGYIEGLKSDGISEGLGRLLDSRTTQITDLRNALKARLESQGISTSDDFETLVGFSRELAGNLGNIIAAVEGSSVYSEDFRNKVGTWEDTGDKTNGIHRVIKNTMVYLEHDTKPSNKNMLSAMGKSVVIGFHSLYNNSRATFSNIAISMGFHNEGYEATMPQIQR